MGFCGGDNDLDEDEIEAKKPENCTHEWWRTGSDTLFCFRCHIALNEPEDK